jgi:LysM repeat protein
LQEWVNYYAARGVTMSNGVPVATNPSPRNVQTAAPTKTDSQSVAANSTRSNTASHGTSTTSNRTHVIVSGETLSTIARRYNVRLSALQAANPTVDAKRLRPGQALIIPPP